MDSPNLKFTVFTATFNRAHLLGRVYESLRNQSFKNFEWLIVDDGSTDKTEEIVSAWVKEGYLSIRYFKQENAGKHAALNLGVQAAKGELFLILDSDDRCVPNALERFDINWNQITPADKPKFSGIFSNCINEDNKIIGSKFPVDILDCSFIDAYYKYNIQGDKWGFFQTNILRAYPFPVIKGEKFLTEAIVWNRIALKFQTRFINENLLLVEYQVDGLSGRSAQLRIKNPLGAALYYQEFLLLPVSIYWKLRNLLNYIRFSFHAQLALIRQIKNLRKNSWRLWYFIFLPFGYFIYKKDCRRFK